MAESLGVAVLELVADTKPLVAGLEKGKAAAEEMAATTAGGFKNGIQKAAIPAALAVGALVVGLHKSLDAAEENQVAQAKLAQAFKTAGLDVNDYKDMIDETEQSSAALGFKSEDVKAALAQLVVATHDAKDATGLLSTAQDLARFKGISLTDASRMLTSTMTGSTRAARQLGIVFKPVTDATDALGSKTSYASLAAYEHAKAVAFMTDKHASAAKMVGLLNDKLGGQADAFANTAQGAKEKMGAEFQLLEINIGNVLIPVLTKVSVVLAGFSQFLVKHATAVKLVLAVIGPLAVGILLLAAYTKIAAAAQAVWNMAMDANPIGLIVIAIAVLVVAFIELWKHSQTFRDIVLGVWSDVSAATSAFVDFFTQKVPAAFQSVKDWVAQHWPEIATLLSGPFAPLVALATNGFGVRSALLGAFRAVLGWFEDKWQDVKGLISRVFTSIADRAADGFGIPDAIRGVFHALRGWFDNTWDDVKGFIKSPFTALLDGASDAFGLEGRLASAWKSIKSGVSDAFGAIGNAAKAAFIAPIDVVIGAIDSIELPVGIHIKTWHGIPDGFSIDWGHPFHIPMLAEGGIVNSPTLAVIGERGPEAVVPLGKGGLGGGITVNVHGVVGNERDVAVKIGRELQQLKNRGLDFGLA